MGRAAAPDLRSGAAPSGPPPPQRGVFRKVHSNLPELSIPIPPAPFEHRCGHTPRPQLRAAPVRVSDAMYGRRRPRLNVQRHKGVS